MSDFSSEVSDFGTVILGSSPSSPAIRPSHKRRPALVSGPPAKPQDTVISVRRRHSGRNPLSGAIRNELVAGRRWGYSAPCQGRSRPLEPTACPCGCGGTGRRTGFRFQRREAWRFESSHPHQAKRPGIDPGPFCLCRAGLSRFALLEAILWAHRAWR